MFYGKKSKIKKGTQNTLLRLQAFVYDPSGEHAKIE